MLVSIQLLDDKNWQTLLRNADVQILSVTVSRVMGRDFPGVVSTTFLVDKDSYGFFLSRWYDFFLPISAIIAVK